MSVDKRDIYPPESSALQDIIPERVTHPKGYEPGMVLEDGGDRLKGVLVPAPRPKADGEKLNPNNPDQEPWAQHLIDAGLDPEDVEVIFPVEIRVWPLGVKNDALIAKIKHALKNNLPLPVYDEADLIIKTKMVYFRARIRSKTLFDPVELAADIEWVKKWKPLKSRPKPKTDQTLVVCWADWQIGKDDGDGLSGTIDRILDSFQQTVDLIKEIKPSKVMILSLGDMIEGCNGWYPQQAFRVEMNLRDQIHTARRLIVRGLKEISDLVPLVEVVAVGGNHGENREDGKSNTDFADNFDVGIYEAVSDQLGENPDRFNNIVFRIPTEELSQTVKERGHVIGVLHGHQVGKGRFTFTKFDNWIKSQAMSRRPIGDADIIINGHYHFHFARYIGQRIHIQAPTLDGGSGWYDEMAGGQEKPGTLVFTLDEGGIDMMKVLPAQRTERPDKWGGA